ncbi:MAG: glycosyltransferase family 4 protein [Acidimicrobiia bacterium]
MRLLLITNDFPPKPGGIQTYLRDLVDAYPDDIVVYAPEDVNAKPDEPGVVRGGRSFMLPTKSHVEDVVRVADDFKPDAILYGAPHPLSKAGPSLREELGIPFGILSHGAEVTIPAAGPGTRQALGRAMGAADVLFAVSRFTAERVTRISGAPALFLGAGVELDTFVPPPSPPRNSPPVVGCVSRFVPRKGQQRLIEAAAELDGEVELLLVGKGRTENKLRRLAERRGVRAQFAIDVPWAELPALYQTMDIFCMPTSSRWGGLEVEGLGLVYLEASATGLPVLAGDSGGSPETVIPGVTGFVVSNVDDIVDGLRILLSNPESARQMGAEGRRFVEKEFTWERVLERLYAGFAPHLR